MFFGADTQSGQGSLMRGITGPSLYKLPTGRTVVRLATLIISLVLSFGLFLQSLAVSVGGSVSEEFAQNSAQRQEAEQLSGAAGLGIVAALLWLVGAGFVISRPRVAVWLYGIAAPLLLGAGAAGFTDGFIWAFVSAGFALMSWRGIKERARKQEQDSAVFQANVAAAAAALQSAPQAQVPAGWYSNPQGQGRRYWNGAAWTDQVALAPEAVPAR